MISGFNNDSIVYDGKVSGTSWLGGSVPVTKKLWTEIPGLEKKS